MKLNNKLQQLIGFGLLFIAFALASNENSTSPNNSNISNTYCLDADAETCDAVTKIAKMLKAKRELSDAPTLLVYIAIAVILVIPQIQFDV